VPGAGLGTGVGESARGLVRDVQFQWDAKLGQKSEDAAELDGWLAVLDVLSELLADADGIGKIVNADAALAANGANRCAQGRCRSNRDTHGFRSYDRRNNI
jgi:hypothetical protein